jgi:hypothetical protein
MNIVRLRWLASAIVVAFTGCGDGTSNVDVRGLRFLEQPVDIAAGQPFTVSVELLDANGARAPGSNAVSIATTGGPVTGPSSVRAANGVATFSGVSVTQAGTAIQLTASAGSLTAASSTFAVSPGAPSAAQSSITPAEGPLAAFAANELLFAFRDEFNNSVGPVPVTISTDLPGSAFIPASGSTTADGTFETTFRPGATGTATIAASVGGTALTFGNTYLVQDVCEAAPFSFPGNVTGVIPNGACVLHDLPSASHQFTTVNEVVAHFTFTAPFGPVFEIAASPPVDNVVLAAESSPIVSEWLLPAGTFKVRVGSSAGAGAYSIIGFVGVSDDGCTTRFLAVAAVYSTQQLRGDDCNSDDYNFFETPDGSRVDFFAIRSTRPCTITMRSAVMNSFLMVADWETLNVFDAKGSGGANQDATMVLPSCTSPTGPLVIVTNHFIDAIGPYTLTVAFTGAAVTGAEAVRAVDAGNARVRAGIPAGIRAGVRGDPLNRSQRIRKIRGSPTSSVTPGRPSR